MSVSVHCMAGWDDPGQQGSLPRAHRTTFSVTTCAGLSSSEAARGEGTNETRETVNLAPLSETLVFERLAVGEGSRGDRSDLRSADSDKSMAARRG